MDFLSLLQFGFIQKAFLAGSFVALSCSVLGLFLVLRRMSLIGDGLSHVSFGALALGMFFGFYPVYFSIPIVVIGSFLILKITEKSKIYGDAAIGIVSAFGVSLGIILASVSGGFNVDLFSYLFGNILSISSSEVVTSILLCAAVLVIVIVLYNELFLVTYDEEYAKVSGIPVKRINALLFALTGITVVLAVRVVGIILVSALLIIPAVTALQLAKGFRAAVIISATISVLSVFFGIIMSILLDIPAGATIIMANLLFFAIVFIIRNISNKSI